MKPTFAQNASYGFSFRAAYRGHLKIRLASLRNKRRVGWSFLA